MNNCGLCQQFNNNLIQIYPKRLKSLAQIILKLKGYKHNWDPNTTLIICEQCKRGLENVATLWESIPEAKQEKVMKNMGAQEEIEEQMNAEEAEAVAVSLKKSNLPAITLKSPQESLSPKTREETYREPIKLRIKLPTKRKKEDKALSLKTSDMEALNPNPKTAPKRLRRPPKRYEDFKTNSTSKCSKTNSKETNLENYPEMASLRLSNDTIIAKLLEVHSSGVSSRMRIICQICPNVFHFEKDFQKHLTTKHNIRIQNGLTDPGPNYLFYCKLCEKSFREHYAVRRHFKSAHSEERPLKCEYCEASFKYKFNLDYHMAKHIRKMPFECVYCKKSFVLRYELQIHLRTHTNERPYKCQFCSFAFAHQSNLKNHQKLKHFKELTNQSNLQNTISNEEIVPNDESVNENLLESTVDNAIEMESTLKEQNQEDLKFSMHFEEFSNNLKDLDTEMFPTATTDLVEEVHNPENDVDNFSSCKTLETQDSDVLNDYIDERFKHLPKNATVHIDSNILKALESSELLGLKKWPKSFQTTTTTKENSCSANLNETKDSEFREIRNTKETLIQNESETNTEEFLNELANETISQPLDLDNDSQNMSLTKYETIQSNNSSNSLNNFTQHGNIQSFSNSSHLPQTPASSKSFKGESLLKSQADNSKNNKLLNFELLSAETLTKGGKFINISQLSKASNSQLDFKPLSALKQIKIIEDNVKTLEENKKLSCPKDRIMEISKMSNSEAKNNSQSWKVIKISSRPVKLRNICNISKITPQSEALNSAAATSNPFNKIVNKISDKLTIKTKDPQFTTISHSFSSKTDNLAVSQIRFDPKNSTSKSSNLPAQSLLKCNSKSNPSHQPLITNIEILPPLNSPSNTNSKTTGPVSLIKPPTDYKYQCPHCWKYFKQKSPLTKHLRTHTGEKPYKCNLCPKSYADASNYKKHKMLHKNAAEALNINRSSHIYTIHNSPAYSTVSDPDPDGIEVMQTINKFKSSSTSSGDEEDDDDDASLTSSNMESYMWQDALENVLKNEEIMENIKKNLAGINNAIMPKSMQQLASKTPANVVDINGRFSSEDPD